MSCCHLLLSANKSHMKKCHSHNDIQYNSTPSRVMLLNYTACAIGNEACKVASLMHLFVFKP